MLAFLLLSCACLDSAVGSSWRDHVANASWYEGACVDDTGLDQVEVLTSDAGVAFVRTPDDRFAKLAEANFPFEPKYVTLEGLRMHYVDVGPADALETILCLHGQPTWSFLYRKMIPTFVDAGFRVIAPDMIGMGRSDKPLDLDFHKYLTHVRLIKGFINALNLQQITAFVQDWGSQLGIRIVGDMPDRFARVVVANGAMIVPATDNTSPFGMPLDKGLNCSDERTVIDMAMQRMKTVRETKNMAAGFRVWVKYSMTQPTWKPSDMLGLMGKLSPQEMEAYDAPFPTILHRTGIRMLPSMVTGMIEPELGNRAAWERLGNFTRPWLQLAGERDRNLGSPANQQRYINHVPGAKAHSQEHKRYDAAHFIQENVGEEMAGDVVRFIRNTTWANNRTTTTIPMSEPVSSAFLGCPVTPLFIAIWALNK